MLQSLAPRTATGLDGHSPDIAKPGHAILRAIAFLLLGKTVRAGARVSTLSGIATVGVTYVIGLRAWGPRVAAAEATQLRVYAMDEVLAARSAR